MVNTQKHRKKNLITQLVRIELFTFDVRNVLKTIVKQQQQKIEQQLIF